jgi:hypothetical protein
MSAAASFAYMQARVQARHGMRPDARVWSRLQGIVDIGNYLHAAQQTTLAPWVSGLHSIQGSHDIEHVLRRQFRDYIDQVAHWLPARWAGTVRWITHLPDMPALLHLLSGEAAPAWMLDDARLRPLASENASVRSEAMLDSEWRYLVLAREHGMALVDAWVENWQRQWPESTRLHVGMTHLGNLFLGHIKMLRANHGGTTPQQREFLIPQLHAAFRRYSFQPAAACAHLALVALDLEKLRGELVSRALFSDSVEVDT